MGTLRDYQEQAVSDLRSSLAQGNKSPCLVMPTGSGKTHVAEYLMSSAAAKGKKSLFLAPRRELVYQASSKLGIVNLDHSIIMAGERLSLIPKVQVACIPTLYRRAVKDGRIPLPQADLVIVDEAHLSIAKSTHELVRHYLDAGAVVVGLTATPCRADGAGLGMVYDDLVLGPDVAHLTDQGHLVPARYFAGQAPDLDGIKVQAGDYHQQQLGERVNDVTLIGDVVENWARLASDRQTFVFAVNVAHSMNLCSELQRIGIKAAHLDGSTPNEERAEILHRLETGEIQVLTNCEVMTYGVDFPPVSCIVLAKPTKSIARYFQMVGRGLRTNPGKTDCMVLDHAQAVQNIGFVDDEMPWSLDGKEKIQDRVESKRSEPEPIECGSCGVEFRPARICPHCGVEQGGKYERAVEAHEAELRELDRRKKLADVRKWEMDDKRQFFAELKAIAQRYGYKRGWAANKYRTRLGVWPNAVKDEPPREPTPATQAWVRSQNIRYAKRQEGRQ